MSETTPKEWEASRDAWVQGHPAMRKALAALAQAKHEVKMLPRALREVYEEASPRPPEPPEPPEVYPDEGITLAELEAREQKQKEGDAGLLARLKETVKAHNVSVPTPKSKPAAPGTVDDLRSALEAAVKSPDLGEMLASIIKEKFGVDLASLTGEKKDGS